MNNWLYADAVPTNPWKGAMTIPRELTLETHNGQLKLVQKAVVELEKMRKNVWRFTNKSLSTINDALSIGSNNLLNISTFKQFELKAKIPVENQKGFTLKFKKRGLQESKFIFDFENHEIRFNRSNSGAMASIGYFKYEQTAPLIIENGYFDLHLFVDNCSAELFASNGQVVMTNQIFPDSTSNRIELTPLGDDFTIEKLEIWRLDKNYQEVTAVPMKEPLFTIYPNPVLNSNGATIKIASNKIGLVIFKIFDSNGKLLLKFQPSSNSMILPRNKFGSSTGPIFIVGSDGNFTQTEKIMVVSQ